MQHVASHHIGEIEMKEVKSNHN